MADSERPKRRRWWILLIVLLLFFSLPIIGVMALIGGISQGKAVESGSTLTLALRGGLAEAPVDPFLARLGQGSPVSVWGIRQALRKAATDDRITSLLIIIEPLGMGWAAVEEVAAEIDRFREKSGKPVHALLRVDLLEEKEYYLATAADRIWLTPGAGVLINGLAAETIFWRGTLEKLHVEPDIIMFHEYKSAGEPFKNKEMSPYYREALSAVIEDIYASFVDRVVQRRGIDAAAVEAVAVQGMTSDDALVEAKMVDSLGYIDEIHELLASLSGQPGDAEFRGVGIGAYLEEPRLPGAEAAAGRIAVVFGEGPIVSGAASGGLFDGDSTIHGPEVAGQLRDAIEDDSVKAIVFRVNSPGGSAVGSDLIWREIRRAKDAGKPVVVSMSTVAGSGGYWISMAADRIVAQPSTITGSIGVVFQKFDLSGFLEWIGAHPETVSVGSQADLLSFTHQLSPEQEAQVRVWMQDIYGQFTEKVAEGRGLPLEKVQEIAKGRIWSGTDALELGLVNELGGLEEAIALARQLSGQPETVPAEAFPEVKPFFQRILEGDLEVAMPALGLRLPQRSAMVEAAMELGRPQVQVLMPDVNVR